MTLLLDKNDSLWDEPKLLKKKRIIGLISAATVLIALVVLTIFLGGPIVAAIRNKASFREWMQGTGFLKYPLMIGIMALQVIIAFIPGEPIEIVAGYVFGAWGGLILCLLGCALGSTLIILMVRKFGMKFVSLFIERNQVENLRFFKDPKKRDATLFLVFLTPGTPKDILTYLAGLTTVPLGKFLIITSIARIPSILSSTMGGNMLEKQEYKYAVIVFAVTLVLTLAATLIYRTYHNKQKRAEVGPESSKEVPAEAKADDTIGKNLNAGKKDTDNVSTQ